MIDIDRKGSSNPSPIDNEYSWFWTILASFKLGFIVLFSNAISWQLYQILMTEIYHFELKPRDVNQLSLSSALSLNSHPYIQVTLNHINLRLENKFNDFEDIGIY